MSQVRLVIVSGLSGSGKSVALHTLEDAGFYCIDNLPVKLLEEFAKYARTSGHRTGDRFGVGIDARNAPEDLRRLPEILARLHATGVDSELIFLYADETTLIRRFSETRRRHPLADDDHPLADALKMERELLEPLREEALWVLDTSHTSVHDLRSLVFERLTGEPASLSVLVESFGYKHGIPTDADYVFDARCLPNPHWEPQLRPHTGRDEAVRRFLEDQPETATLYRQIHDLVAQWIPTYLREGRTYLTVAIGCTGGQHRSVYLAERLAADLRTACDHVALRHRELS